MVLQKHPVLPLVIWCILNSEFSEDRVLMILQLVVLCMYVCVFMCILSVTSWYLNYMWLTFPFLSKCFVSVSVSEFYT